MSPESEQALRVIFLDRTSDELESVRKIAEEILNERRMMTKAGLN